MGQLVPDGLDHVTRVIQVHFPVDDFAKQTRTMVRTQGHNTGAGLGIIISFKPYGMSIAGHFDPYPLPFSVRLCHFFGSQYLIEWKTPNIERTHFNFPPTRSYHAGLVLIMR
jgi:hypothetical protein